MFSCVYCEMFSRKTYFEEHLRMAGSDFLPFSRPVLSFPSTLCLKKVSSRLMLEKTFFGQGTQYVLSSVNNSHVFSRGVFMNLSNIYNETAFSGQLFSYKVPS